MSRELHNDRQTLPYERLMTKSGFLTRTHCYKGLIKMTRTTHAAAVGTVQKAICPHAAIRAYYPVHSTQTLSVRTCQNLDRIISGPSQQERTAVTDLSQMITTNCVSEPSNTSLTIRLCEGKGKGSPYNRPRRPRVWVEV